MSDHSARMHNSFNSIFFTSNIMLKDKFDDFLYFSYHKKNTVSHTVALGDTEIHHDEHEHSSLYMYTVLLL